MKVVFVVSQVTIKVSLITCGEAYPVLRLNDPVEAVHPTGELEGEFHNCDYGILRSTFSQQLRAIISHCRTFVILSNITGVRVLFLIALFSFENISHETRSGNRYRFARKKWYRRSITTPFSAATKNGAKKRTLHIHYITLHIHESVNHDFLFSSFFAELRFFSSSCR